MNIHNHSVNYLKLKPINHLWNLDNPLIEIFLFPDFQPEKNSHKGIQCCSAEYVKLLQQHHAMISMTNNGDPLENVVAKRVNGILKTELISRYYPDTDAASIHITRCITIYNYRRRHSSLNWQIPADVNTQKGPQIRRWKNYYQNNTKQKEAAMLIT